MFYFLIHIEIFITVIHYYDVTSAQSTVIHEIFFRRCRNAIRPWSYQ